MAILPDTSRGNNIGYRVVQQQPMGSMNDDDDDDDDGNLEAVGESSDDERSGYPTLPVDGIGSRPSVNSLRHVSLYRQSHVPLWKKKRVGRIGIIAKIFSTETIGFV